MHAPIQQDLNWKQRTVDNFSEHVSPTGLNVVASARSVVIQVKRPAELLLSTTSPLASSAYRPKHTRS